MSNQRTSPKGRINFHAKGGKVIADFSFQSEKVSVTGSVPVSVVTDELLGLFDRLCDSVTGADSKK